MNTAAKVRANAAVPVLLAGVSFNFALGQMVSLKSGHVGHIGGLHYDSETGLPYADVWLIDPIEFPPYGPLAAVTLHRQCLPITDLKAADENAIIRYRLSTALVKAASFIEGFENDELQEGIADLLKEIRAALSLVPA